MMKALFFTFFMIIFITAGFMFMAYVGCGGYFLNKEVGFTGGISFLSSLIFSPGIFDFYNDYVD